MTPLKWLPGCLSGGSPDPLEAHMTPIGGFKAYICISQPGLQSSGDKSASEELDQICLGLLKIYLFRKINYKSLVSGMKTIFKTKIYKWYFLAD